MALGIKVPERESKYHNRPGRLDGVAFDSQMELRRYAYLVHVEMAGLLSALHVHPQFALYAATAGAPAEIGVYEADFSYLDDHGQQVVEDVKGLVLPVYQLKRRLFLANYPQLKFQEVKQCRRRWMVTPMSA
jgi:hypothetical protein